MHIYNIPFNIVSELLGPKPRSLMRWYARFLSCGTVSDSTERNTRSRWPPHVLTSVQRYVTDHPTFYIEELQTYIQSSYPDIKNCFISTICRALNFDLKLSRKVLTKAARECVPAEVQYFKEKLIPIYSYPEQMLFLDETSKDGRDAYRRYAWSLRNTKAVARLPLSRGKRLSILAALDVHGFVAWETTEGTFTREAFHNAFLKRVVPLLNPWPLPHSIVVLDNAKIHLYDELQDAVHQCGARLIFLPPYSPQLNPIEICFGLLKRWIQKNANLVFPLYPEKVLEIAMKKCTVAIPRELSSTFSHCGYAPTSLRNEAFAERARASSE